MSENSNIEFRIAKTGHLVPVVDQIFLHSIFDPIKEAEVFVESHLTEIENNPCHLIFGLGFGYHVFKVMERLQEIHGNKAQIMVIEANQHMVERFLDYSRDKGIAVKFNILTGAVNDLYTHERLLHFLLTRPQILIHKASFQKDKEYYGNFLKYQADKKLTQLWSYLRPGVQEMLAPYKDYAGEVTAITREKNENAPWERADYFLQLFNHIAQSSVGKN